MALTSQKAGRLCAIGLLLAGTLAAQTRFEATHKHLRKGCRGILLVSDRGIAFEGPKKHHWQWSYTDIQQLKLTADGIHLLTYRDSLLRLGADRDYEFRGQVPKQVYQLWKEKLDQRFVAELADPGVRPLWELPAKRLGRLGGVQGILKFGEDRIIFEASRGEQSRTWRFRDIDNIATTGPFDFTITSFERARMQYGSRRQFQFQLKEPLTDARYNELWRRINQKNGRIQ